MPSPQGLPPAARTVAWPGWSAATRTGQATKFRARPPASLPTTTSSPPDTPLNDRDDVENPFKVSELELHKWVTRHIDRSRGRKTADALHSRRPRAGQCRAGAQDGLPSRHATALDGHEPDRLRVDSLRRPGQSARSTNCAVHRRRALDAGCRSRRTGSRRAGLGLVARPGGRSIDTGVAAGATSTAAK